MASFKILIAVLALCCSVTRGQGEYEDSELPGIVSPLGDLDDVDENFSDEVDADPTPCQYAVQYQANISTQIGVSSSKGAKFIGTNTQVFVDSTNKRVAGKGGSGNCTRAFIVLFGSNNTAKVYVWSPAKQKCFTRNLNRIQWRPQQVPPNATFVKTIILGPKSGGLSVDVFGFGGRSTDKRHGKTAGVRGNIMVVRSGCVPVIAQLHGRSGRRPRLEENTLRFEQNKVSFEDEEEQEQEEEQDEIDKRRPRPRPRPRPGVGFVDTIVVNDFVPSISDPSVFTPPSYCNKTLAYDDDHEELPGIIDNFVEF